MKGINRKTVNRAGRDHLPIRPAIMLLLMGALMRQPDQHGMSRLWAALACTSSISSSRVSGITPKAEYDVPVPLSYENVCMDITSPQYLELCHKVSKPGLFHHGVTIHPERWEKNYA